MLATHIATEINQRWEELAQLPDRDRARKLESLIERHVLATGPCCSATYLPKDEDFPDFASREKREKLEKH